MGRKKIRGRRVYQEQEKEQNEPCNEQIPDCFGFAHERIALRGVGSFPIYVTANSLCSEQDAWGKDCLPSGEYFTYGLITGILSKYRDEVISFI